jgi:hypothetical protein
MVVFQIVYSEIMQIHDLKCGWDTMELLSFNPLQVLGFFRAVEVLMEPMKSGVMEAPTIPGIRG